MADLYGLFFLAPVLVENGEAFVAEGAGVASLDSSAAVLDEDYEVHLIASVLKITLGERNVGELEVFGAFSEVEGSVAQGTGKIEVAARPGPGTRSGEESRGGYRRVLGGLGRKNGDDAFYIVGET